MYTKAEVYRPFVTSRVTARMDKTIEPGHDNDVYIAGYSDQILRFIAERGDGGQLLHVERIDDAYSLAPLPPGLLQQQQQAGAGGKTTSRDVAAVDRPLPLASFVPRLVLFSGRVVAPVLLYPVDILRMFICK